MTWESFPWGPAVTIAVLMWGVALLAMDERNRRKFLTREESEGMRKRLEADLQGAQSGCARNEAYLVGIDDRVGDLEEKAARIEERQTQQWERISEQMAHTAETIRAVTAELKEISRMQQDHAIRLERMHRGDTPR